MRVAEMNWNAKWPYGASPFFTAPASFPDWKFESPLQDRKRLAPKVDSAGNPVPGWEAPAQIDGDGC